MRKLNFVTLLKKIDYYHYMLEFLQFQYNNSVPVSYRGKSVQKTEGKDL